MSRTAITPRTPKTPNRVPVQVQAHGTPRAGSTTTGRATVRGLYILFTTTTFNVNSLALLFHKNTVHLCESCGND